ncbi:oxidoreductase [Pedobacter sp.]|uniref:oxidoreductase n=1 Tax=Pedobacter sp. TaxID=1411316 RepID=UPI003D7FA308
MKAVLLGASGLIGSSLLKQLLENPHFTEVLILVRKPLDLQHPKLTVLVVDFDKLREYAEKLKVDVVFCCLGTTKKKTPNQEDYRKIDYQYPLDMAWIAYTNGASQYHLVSAMGANPHSSIFYSRLKGEVERDLKTVPFKTIHIYRPSLLDGKRKEQRFGEELMIYVMRVINPLLIGGLRKYRSVKIEKVAAAMLRQSLTDKKGIFIHQSDELQ